MPLVEAFYKQVPVLAYAATAVPATMDGAGVLFDDKDPRHVAALMDAILSDPDSAGRHRRGPARGGRSAAGEGLRRHAAAASSTRSSARRAQGAPRVAFDFWHQFDASEELEEIRMYRPSAFKALPESAGVIVNQWVPAAHKGDAIGDSARRMRGLLRAMGHTSEIYALTIDDELQRRRAAVRRSGGAAAAI